MNVEGGLRRGAEKREVTNEINNMSPLTILEFSTFIAGFVVGFVQGWQLTLGILLLSFTFPPLFFSSSPSFLIYEYLLIYCSSDFGSHATARSGRNVYGCDAVLDDEARLGGIRWCWRGC